MTRLGLQIPNFTYPGVPDENLFRCVADQALTAEESGFDTVFVMDHFYQLPALGRPDHAMLEAYTLLGGIAARTRSARLAALVTGNTYRNPAHLAKIVTTLDLVSEGRAMLGIGAGWFEPEHAGYGFAFPPLGERLDRLEEALQIIHPMLRGERPTFEGRFYRASEAINQPRPLQGLRLPILIGGNGEKRTLRLVARFAEESNLTCATHEIPRKLEALERHCAEQGRDRCDIAVSWLGSFVLGDTHEAAEGLRNEFLAARGMNWDTLPDAVRTRIRGALVVGDADEICEHVEREIIGQGLNGVVANLPSRGWQLESVAHLGEVLSRVL